MLQYRYLQKFQGSMEHGTSSAELHVKECLCIRGTFEVAEPRKGTSTNHWLGGNRKMCKWQVCWVHLQHCAVYPFLQETHRILQRHVERLLRKKRWRKGGNEHLAIIMNAWASMDLLVRHRIMPTWSGWNRLNKGLTLGQGCRCLSYNTGKIVTLGVYIFLTNHIPK